MMMSWLNDCISQSLSHLRFFFIVASIFCVYTNLLSVNWIVSSCMQWIVYMSLALQYVVRCINALARMTCKVFIYFGCQWCESLCVRFRKTFFSLTPPDQWDAVAWWKTRSPLFYLQPTLPSWAAQEDREGNSMLLALWELWWLPVSGRHLHLQNVSLWLTA